MRKTLLMAGALLALTATVALAQTGVDLAWNQCSGQVGAAANKTNTCAATTGSQSLFGSVNPPAGIVKLEGLEAYIDYQVAGGTLDCWWDFHTGTTRAAALVPLHVAPADANGDPLILCGNYYFGSHAASGGGGMIVTGPDRGQLKGIVAIQAGTGVPVPAGAQQYGWGCRITNALTTTCAGCNRAAVFVLNRIVLTQPGLPNTEVTSPAVANCATWQDPAGNCGATPARNKTWGSVKALYR
jgi:hypothetical protein